MATSSLQAPGVRVSALGGCDDDIEAAARGLDVSKAGRLEKGGGENRAPLCVHSGRTELEGERERKCG